MKIPYASVALWIISTLLVVNQYCAEAVNTTSSDDATDAEAHSEAGVQFCSYGLACSASTPFAIEWTMGLCNDSATNQERALEIITLSDGDTVSAGIYWREYEDRLGISETHIMTYANGSMAAFNSTSKGVSIYSVHLDDPTGKQQSNITHVYESAGTYQPAYILELNDNQVGLEGCFDDEGIFGSESCDGWQGPRFIIADDGTCQKRVPTPSLAPVTSSPQPPTASGANGWSLIVALLASYVAAAVALL